MQIDRLQAQIEATSQFAQQLEALLSQDPTAQAQLQNSALQQKQNTLTSLQALLDSTTAARAASASAYDQQIATLQGQIGAVKEQINQASATSATTGSADAAQPGGGEESDVTGNPDASGKASASTTKTAPAGKTQSTARAKANRPGEQKE